MSLKVKRYRWLLMLSLLGVLLVGNVAIAFKASLYQPSSSALSIESQTSAASDYYLIKNRHKLKGNIIVYPGALVDPRSYQIWAEKVASAGYRVYLLKMPLALAVLEPNRADDIIEKHPQQRYFLAGHSLGGVMASRFTSRYRNRVAGIIFLASYPDQKGNLRKTKLPVLSVTASRDGVLNWQRYRQAKSLLPVNTEYQVIAGGNHGGFGSYGHQKGDKTAKISNQSQQNQIAKIILEWLAIH